MDESDQLSIPNFFLAGTLMVELEGDEGGFVLQVPRKVCGQRGHKDERNHERLGDHGELRLLHAREHGRRVDGRNAHNHTDKNSWGSRSTSFRSHVQKATLLMTTMLAGVANEQEAGNDEAVRLVEDDTVRTSPNRAER